MNHTVEEVSLNNGAKALFIHIDEALVFDLYAELNAGHLFAPRSKRELAHVVEHMMFATKKYPAKNQFAGELEKNGAYKNAYTADSYLAYDYQCAKFEDLRIIDLFGQQLTQPVFNAQELTTELGNVNEELSEVLSDNGRLAAERLQEELNDDVNTSTRIAQLSDIKRDDVVKFYKDTHFGSNLRLIVAGDLSNRQKVIDALNANLKELPKGRRLSIPKVKYQAIKDPIIEHRDINQVYYVARSYAVGKVSKREYWSAQLIRMLLSSGYRSKIYGRLRAGGLAYAYWSGVSRNTYAGGYWFGGFATPSNVSKVFQVITEETQAVLNGKITDRDLRGVKQLAKGRYARSYQTPRQLVNWYDDYTQFDEVVKFEDYPKTIDEITKEEALESFKKLIQSTKWGISFVGPVKEAEAENLKKMTTPLWSK